MVINFTSLQLVRYIYQDCSSTEAESLKEYLDSDPEAQEELFHLRQAKITLPKALFSAHPNSISNIVVYSRKMNV